MEKPSTQPLIHPETRIGHVHLKVANIERSLGFYRDLLGFEVTQWYGEDAVFLSAGGYHHHIGLNTWAGRNVPPAPRRAAGLFHLAILYPERRELAKALRSLIDAGYPLDGASDHGVSEALYLSDPDDNGVELYCDRWTSGGYLRSWKKCRVRNAGPTPLTAPPLSRSARNLLVTPRSRRTRGKGRRSPTASGLLSGACSEAR